MGGDLREVGDDDDLGVPGELLEALADGEGGPAADPGVDLVEDEDGRGAAVAAGGGEGDLEGEHDAGELAAGGGLGDGARRGAGVRGEQDRDGVAAVGAGGLRGDVDGDRGVGHLEQPQLLLHGGGERGGGLGAGGGELRGDLVELLLEGGEASGELVPLGLRALEAVEVHGGGAGGLEQGGDVLGGPVGAGQEGAEVPHEGGELGEALVRGVHASRGGVDALGVEGELGGEVGDLDAQGVEPLPVRLEVAVGEHPGAGGAGDRLRGDVDARAGGGAVVADEGVGRGGAGAPELLGAAEALELGAQLVVLPRLRVRGLDALERLLQGGAAALAVRQQGVDLGEAGAGGGALGPEGAMTLEVGSHALGGEAVQGLALGVGVAEPLLVGLPVDGDGAAHEVGEGADGHGHAADLGARAAVAGDAADDEHLAVLLLGAELVERAGEPVVAGDGEGAVHGGGDLGAAPVQAGAEQHGQPRDDHGLARAGLAGQGGEAGTELEGGVVDHADVADPQGGQHVGPPVRPAGPRGRASPRRAAGTSPPGGRRRGCS